MNYPTELIIETSSLCDLKCVMCPQSDPDINRPKIFLPEEIIDKISSYITTAKYLQLHGIGEPLLSPSFWKVLTFLSKDSYASVNSNFLNVTEDKMYKLASSNLGLVNISLDSPDINTYYKIRGADLNKVINNIKKLVEIIKQVNSRLRVALNMTLMRENIEQINQTLDLCKELGCYELWIWPMNNSCVLDKELYGWKFVYEYQSPYNFKELYNETIQKAIDHSKQIDMRFNYSFI